MLETKQIPKFFKKDKKMLLAAAVAILLVAFAIAYLISKNMNDTPADKGKVVFVIEGENYYQNDLEPVLKYPYNRGLEKDEAAKEAFELYKKIKAAKKLDINPAEEEIQSEKLKLIKELGGEYNEPDDTPWIDLLAQSNAIDKAVSAQQNYKGYSFDVFFGQHLQYGPAFKPEDLNDQQLAAEDKQYAEEKANFYHDQLKTNKMTPDEVLKALNSDRRLSALPAGKTSYSVKFGYSDDEDTSWSNEIFHQSIVDFVQNQQQTGLSDIQIGEASVDGSATNFADMYYYFVLTEEVPEGPNITKEDFDRQLSELTTEYLGL